MNTNISSPPHVLTKTGNTALLPKIVTEQVTSPSIGWKSSALEVTIKLGYCRILQKTDWNDNAKSAAVEASRNQALDSCLGWPLSRFPWTRFARQDVTIAARKWHAGLQAEPPEPQVIWGAQPPGDTDSAEALSPTD